MGEFVLVPKEIIKECKLRISCVINRLDLNRRSKRRLKKEIIAIYEKLDG
ncbi:MAG: hypothetical protein ACFFAO_12095 [Candidatus Hermodarchaeota archaeon]